MVSVVLICHNYGRYIQECLNSIYLNEQDLIKDIVIVNDSSSDNSSEIIEKNRISNKKIKHFKTDFQSLSKSYNYGVSKAETNWISKIDADDLYVKNFISNFYNHLIKNKLDFIYGDLLVLNNKSGEKKIKSQKVPDFLKLIKYPVGSGTIYNKKIWEEVGGFDENLRYQDDYDFWLKVNKLKRKIGYINQVGYVHRKHNKNMSKNFLNKNLTKIKVFFNNY